MSSKTADNKGLTVFVPRLIFISSETCAAGYFVNNHDCQVCPKNYYTDGGMITSCTECKDHEYSTAGICEISKLLFSQYD